MTTKNEYTHKVAAVAYILYNRKFLLLKRNNYPKIWGPPGGRLERDEHPLDGLRREIREECGIEIDIVRPVDIWHGDFGRGTYISLDYLALCRSEKVRLSDEHGGYCWAGMDDLKQGKPKLAETEPAFGLKDFERAWSLYLALVGSGLIVNDNFLSHHIRG